MNEHAFLAPTTAVKKLMAFVAFSTLTAVAAATPNYFQGFEVNTGDWVASAAITRVPSLGGTLLLPASSGGFYAEIKNLQDGYSAPFGDAGFSRYGGYDSVYGGDFYQAIDVYIDVSWAVPVPYPALEAFWIDMTPYHADPGNYGAEHNFRIKALGGTVEVFVDGQPAPMATLNSSGWYTFMMTWRKDAVATNPVITDMNVYNATHALVGTTQVLATSPGGPFLSSDLKGNGYVWITVWQDGFANDVMGIDNQRTGLLPWRPIPATAGECKNGRWTAVSRTDGSTFKNQGDCIQYVNTGK
jgi:hypothetical protein